MNELCDEVIYVAKMGTKKINYYHAMENDYASLVLMSETEVGLLEILSGRCVSDDKLIEALSA